MPRTSLCEILGQKLVIYHCVDIEQAPCLAWSSRRSHGPRPWTLPGRSGARPAAGASYCWRTSRQETSTTSYTLSTRSHHINTHCCVSRSECDCFLRGEICHAPGFCSYFLPPIDAVTLFTYEETGLDQTIHYVKIQRFRRPQSP